MFSVLLHGGDSFNLFLRCVGLNGFLPLRDLRISSQLFELRIASSTAPCLHINVFLLDSSNFATFKESSLSMNEDFYPCIFCYRFLLETLSISTNSFITRDFLSNFTTFSRSHKHRHVRLMYMQNDRIFFVFSQP